MKQTQEAQKQQVAKKALALLCDEKPSIIGVGSGSTVSYFIEGLRNMHHNLEGVVAASQASEALLRQQHIPVVDLNVAGDLPLYFDGADEVNAHRQMIKGGGGALTREKIIAACAKQFICMVDPSKKVDILGNFPLPLEVIPMARSAVGRCMVKLGGDPVYRAGFVTDNGNVIIDVHNLDLVDPVAMEKRLNNIPGIVTNGIFALRCADIVIP